MVELLAVLPDLNGWGQVVAQLGVGGAALLLLAKLGKRYLDESANHLEAANEARDRDLKESRDERKALIDVFRQEQAAERDLFREVSREHRDELRALRHTIQASS